MKDIHHRNDKSKNRNKKMEGKKTKYVRNK